MSNTTPQSPNHDPNSDPENDGIDDPVSTGSATTGSVPTDSTPTDSTPTADAQGAAREPISEQIPESLVEPKPVTEPQPVTEPEPVVDRDPGVAQASGVEHMAATGTPRATDAEAASGVPAVSDPVASPVRDDQYAADTDTDVDAASARSPYARQGYPETAAVSAASAASADVPKSSTAHVSQSDESPQTWAPEPAAAAPQIVTPVYITAPVEPKRKGNRGAGILIALLATLVYAIVTALVVWGIFALTKRPGAILHNLLEYLGTPSFYVPIIFFALAFFLLIAIVNRGGWWAYVLGAFVVGAIVYFAYVGSVLLTVQAWNFSPSEVGQILAQLWASPFTFAAAIVAREVPIWFGAWIAARGRRVTARNEEAQRQYEREVAEGPQSTQPTQPAV
jgi:hypothetical protein